MLALQRESVQHKLQTAKAAADAATVALRSDQLLEAFGIDILKRQCRSSFLQV